MDNDVPLKSRWIPELKSIIALFVGLFCILCFKKLIGFGRRWKNILIDWGYRSLNVPSLWIPDAVSHGGRGTLDHAPPINFGSNVEAVKKQFRRVPALRLPDAWPNFLLTWMYLNLSTMSSLIPAWISAVNEELAKVIARSKKSTEGNPRFKGYHLELKSLLSDSIPPRLSNVETSASGSTKELHFRCTFSSPCVSLQVELSTPSADSDDSDLRKTVHVLRLRQNACRVQLICAALEGGYVLLSWKLISPLIINQLSLLSADLQEDKTMTSVDARWIKDTLYQGIQSAVTRIILSPFCVTPVQKLTADRTTTEIVPTISGDSIQYKPSSGLDHPPGCRCSTGSFNNGAHSVRIRIVSAILLEPLDQAWLSQLRRCAWRCQLRSNAALGPSWKISDELVGRSCLLATTPSAHLESRSWPTESQRSSKPVYPSGLQPLDTSSTTFVVVWNFDTQIPTNKLNSDLLDVVLFTEADPGHDTSVHVSGHAVLPLATSSECCAHAQHVVLVDCCLARESGQSEVDERSPLSPPESVGSPSVKFMLTLKVQMSPVDCASGGEVTDGLHLPQTDELRWTRASMASATQSHLSSSIHPESWLNKYPSPPSEPIVSSITGSHSSSVEASVDPLSPEQISDFMTKPSSAFEQNGTLNMLRHGKIPLLGTNTQDSVSQTAAYRRSEPQRISTSAPEGSPTNSTGCPVSSGSFEPNHNQSNYSTAFKSTKAGEFPRDSFSLNASPLATSPARPGAQTPPAKKHRRFFRFRSNTTSSRGTNSSRDQMDSELVSNGVSNFVEGFIEPSMAAMTPDTKGDASGKTHHTFGSRFHRLFQRSSIRRRRKSYDHVSSELSAKRVNKYSHDTHSII